MSDNLSGDLLDGWRVLIVDDDPDSLDIIKTLVQRYGATAYTATDGLLGLELAKQHRPDFIISDLAMPNLDGWQMVSLLKNNRATIDIPVVALTAYGAVGDREKALAAGFHNYLSKPLEAHTFIRDLLRLLIDIPNIAERLSETDL